MDGSDQPELVDYCAETFGLQLGHDDLARIDRFLDLLALWNQRLRLTGERDRTTLLRKHVADALACVPLLQPHDTFLDIGTGAGFPGAVVACVRPELESTLLDARQRPVSFLSEVIRAVPLPHARALAMRAEDAARDATVAGKQSIVTSRAVRFEQFLPLARPLLAPGGRIVAMQTPGLDRARSTAAARRLGLELIDVRDYHLPGGEARRLLILG